jgi:type IV pilus assembly protein PilO
MSLRDPRTQKILISALACFAVMWSFFVADFLPFGYQRRSKEISRLRSEYERVAAEVEKARRTVATLPQLEREHAELQKRWNEAQELLPTDKEMARLLTQITQAGQESGVEFELFKPGAPRPQEFFNENPIEVQIAGGYHQLGVFLSRLANLSRLVNVSQLNLKGFDAKTREKLKEEGREDQTLTANFLATAYSLRDVTRAVEDTAPQQPGGKARTNKGKPTRAVGPAKDAASAASAGGRKP